VPGRRHDGLPVVAHISVPDPVGLGSGVAFRFVFIFSPLCVVGQSQSAMQASGCDAWHDGGRLIAYRPAMVGFDGPKRQAVSIETAEANPAHASSARHGPSMASLSLESSTTRPKITSLFGNLFLS
jgi:hypothetical protein